MEKGLLAFILAVLVLIAATFIISTINGRSLDQAILDSFNMYRKVFDSIDKVLSKIAIGLLALTLGVVVIHFIFTAA